MALESTELRATCGGGGFRALDRLRAVPWPSLRPDLALPAIGRVLSGVAAERELDRVLRANRDLSAAERTALVEAIFGVALWRRRLAVQAGSTDPAALLDGLLQLGGASLASATLPSGRASASPPGSPAWPSTPGRRGAPTRGSGGPSLATQGGGEASFSAPGDWTNPGALRVPGREPRSLGERWSLPDWLAALFVRELGEAEAEAFAAAISAPGPICLRANLLRCSREELAARLGREGIATRPARLAPHGLLVDTPRPNLLGLAAWREGFFEAQDEGSQLLGALVGARPGETVLDLCAGAGGKSLLLAAELGNRGAVLAHDADRERLARLQRRAARAGATCVRVTAPEPADRVLVDAPCSELGALRRGPDARWRIAEESLSALPALQRALLEEAAPLARGRLVYATCTLRREENEDVAHAFERAHPEFVRIAPPWCATSAGFFRSLPHLHDTDAFFAASWDRRAPAALR